MAHISKFNYDEHEIEHAIDFLVRSVSDTGHNSKPVILHSIRVATILWESGIPQKYVIAAVLHDILEDTLVTKGEIADKFSSDIADIVEKLSFYKKADFKKSFLASKRDLFIASIRAADLIDNSNYYNLKETKDNNQSLFVFEKFQYFLDNVSDVLPKKILAQLKDSICQERFRME